MYVCMREEGVGTGKGEVGVGDVREEGKVGVREGGGVRCG